MRPFWRCIVNNLLDVLYHGQKPDDPEKDWVGAYYFECLNMIEDIEHFHAAIFDAGHEISNETMANFLIYAEFMHIGNELFVQKAPVDMKELIAIAAQINDELN